MALILVADDDPDICELVSLKLTHQGHDVVRAVDGAQALELLVHHDFDLLVLDCMMPHHSGQQVLATVRADPSRRGLPVILMSAHADERAVADGRSLGADLFLAKPFSLAQFCADVDGLLAPRDDVC